MLNIQPFTNTDIAILVPMPISVLATVDNKRESVLLPYTASKMSLASREAIL